LHPLFASTSRLAEALRALSVIDCYCISKWSVLVVCIAAD